MTVDIPHTFHSHQQASHECDKKSRLIFLIYGCCKLPFYKIQVFHCPENDQAWNKTCKVFAICNNLRILSADTTVQNQSAAERSKTIQKLLIVELS
jgi:hypothetical protein